MQLMPGTVHWMHHRFNNNFDVNTLDGNTKLGTAYLEWLIVYFGIFYFGESFNLSTSAPVGPDGAQVVLRAAVIAAYNVGLRRGREHPRDPERGRRHPGDPQPVVRGPGQRLPGELPLRRVLSRQGHLALV